ncbi:MAG: ATP-binding protein [Campylobacterales bacterium]
MNKKDIIKTLIKDFHTKPLRRTKSREYNIPLDIEKVVILTGSRRSGKTSLLLNTIERLIQDVPIENIIYINFEDERLMLKAQELDLILQSFQELYPQKELSDCYLFFDEIQEVEGWEKFIRRCDETITRHIYLTGSNAKLLGSEIATALRGRGYRIEIYPLSFKEYLFFIGIELEFYSTANRALILNAFERYLHFGGFPELAEVNNDEQKRKILQEYYDVMLFRDIIERYSQTNITAIKYFFKRLVESVKSPLSISKIHNEMKSLGFRVGKNSLYDFFEYAEAAYFAIPAKKYDLSIKKQELSNKKSYIIDNGYLSALTHKYTHDRGKKLENLIAIELKRREYELLFSQNGSECDFIIDKEPYALQVSFDTSSFETLEREVNGAINGAKLLGCKRATILTFDQERTITRNGVDIELMNAWRWLLTTTPSS